MVESSKSPLPHEMASPLIRLVAIGVLSVVVGFGSWLIAIAVGGFWLMKTPPYIFAIPIPIGVLTALLLFLLWPRSKPITKEPDGT